MADKGLLDVIKDEDDKRKRLVTLLQAGRVLKTKASNVPNEISCKFKSIDSTQAKQLMQLLDLVVSDLAD